MLKLKTTAAQVLFQPGASAACLVISKKTDKKKCIIKDLLTLTRSYSDLITCSYEKNTICKLFTSFKLLRNVS